MPGPCVGDGEQDAVAVVQRLHHDLRRRAVGRSGRGSTYLMALSTRLASAWLTSSRLPLTARRRVGLHLERDALLFRQRLVKLADVVRDLGGVELVHVVARLPGFGARDHQAAR